MSRNSQGLYTLPPGNPVDGGTLIESAWANSTMSDIATALTGSLPRDGTAPMTGPLTLANSTPTDGKHATSKAYVDQFVAYATGLPVGAVVAYAAGNAPGGFLKCDGQAVSRTAYPALFTAIGTTYGAGNGTSTFNVPDLRDWFIRGKGINRAVGSKQNASFASHTHSVTDPGHAHSATDAGHTHGASQLAHSHTITDPQHSHTLNIWSTAENANHTHPIDITSTGQSVYHSHGVNDPGHSHGYSRAISGGNQKPANSGTAPFDAYDSPATTSATTQITIQLDTTDHTHRTVGNTGGTSATHQHNVSGGTSTSATNVSVANAQPAVTVATAATGVGIASGKANVSVGAAGSTETVPQNVAMDYYIKAINDSSAGVVPSNSDPLMDGLASAGGSSTYSRGDHVHPSDTSRASLVSPVFTGTPTAPTAAVDTSTTQIATTQFVTNQKGTDNPLMDGVADAGVSERYSSQDHVHPTDTTLAPLDSPALVGVPTAPTAADGTSTTQIATTEFVLANSGGVASDAIPSMDGTAAAGVSDQYSRGDHVHGTDTSRAPVDSPALTGIPTAPTATVGTNTTQIATTAFVLANAGSGGGTPSDTNPLMDGVAAPGTSADYSRGDHVHPSDTSRAPLASPALTGVPTAPTATTGTSTTQIATTEFVADAVAASGGLLPSNDVPLMDGVGAPGVGAEVSRSDHVHPSDTTKAPIASPTFTGTPAAPTATAGTSTTQLATTAFVTGAISTASGSALQKTSNLSDLTNVATARSNLGLSTKTQFNTACTDGDFAFLNQANTFAGRQTFDAGIVEQYAAVAATTIDCSLASVFSKTISGATSLTVSNVPADTDVASFILELTNGGSATVTWWAGVKWAAGAAPTLTAAGVDILGFYTHDAGVSWRGSVIAKDSK